MDNLQPIILNNSNGGSDWKEHNATTEAIYSRHNKTRLGSEKLVAITDAIIQDNIRKGNLTTTASIREEITGNKLDEVDKYAEEHEERMTHEEVLNGIREKCINCEKA